MALILDLHTFPAVIPDADENVPVEQAQHTDELMAPANMTANQIY